MFVEDHSRYALITNTNSSRRGWTADKRTVILICTLALPVIFFCATYMTSFGIYQKIVYPTTYTIKEVPESSIYRANTYNSLTENELKNLTKYIPQIQTRKKSDDFPSTNNQYKLVCYFNFPSGELNALLPSKIDPFLCTHINLAFAEVYNNTIQLTSAQINSLTEMVKLKILNPNLKILLSIGGAGETDGFAAMVLNHNNRKSFIKSVRYYVKYYNIDGIDLDWEFPNLIPGSDKLQRMHFTQLLEELRININRQEKYKFLVSVAVAAPQFIVDVSYDVMYMNDYVDYINVMSYDFHFYTEVTPFTGLNSPLYPSNNENFYFSTLNINFTANFWHYKGMDKNKIVIGLPTYGHSFKLRNIRNNGLYAPVSGYGKLGTNGFADYMQICEFLDRNQISPVFDMETRSPYASKYFEWISFDDEESLSFKAEYIRENNYGGAMVYSLNADDHFGVCTPCFSGSANNCRLYINDSTSYRII